MRKSRLSNFKVQIHEFVNITTSSEPFTDFKQIEFLLLNHDEIDLEIPTKLCAFGHKISVILKTSGGENNTEVGGTGSITEMENLEDNRVYVRIKLQNYDTMALKIVQHEFYQLIDQVQALMTQMKGA